MTIPNVRERLFAPSRTLAIYNPTSGTAASKRRAKRLVTKLVESGYQVLCSRSTEQLSEVARGAIGSGVQSVIVMGGDGTLWEVIGRIPPQAAIAYFPGGTANLFALNWRIPHRPEAWLKLLEGDVVQPVRFGRCNERPFASVASVGFDALVVARTPSPLKTMLSNGAYALEFIPSYLIYDVPRFKVTIDGSPWEEDVLGVIVGRGPHYGGSFRILPEPGPSAPHLVYAILSGKSKWTIGRFAIGILFEVLSKMHGVHCGMAHEITVDTDPPSCVQLDGDFHGRTPVRFSVEESDRLVLVPPLAAAVVDDLGG